MAFGKELWRRLLYLARHSRVQSDLAGEMEFHIECRAGELEQEGVSREEALKRARREFGSTVRTVEDTHGAWQIRWIEDIFSDLRYAGRAFRRNPGFALTAVSCLALGIGANTAIFSITTSFLFSQPSCRDAASLILIWERGSDSSSLADYKFLRDAHIFEATGGLNPEAEVNWREGSQTSRLYAGVVTDDFFSNMGVPFLLGRGIAPGETTTAVISERLWRSRFASDPRILGRPMTLDGRVYSIAGVLPADNRSIIGFGWSADVYISALHDDDRVQFYARLPKGMTRQVAKARLESLFAALDHIHPLENQKRAGNTRITGVSLDLDPHLLTRVFAFFTVLMIVVGLVLLIACANVSSLLLARASGRSQELAIRLSLGASRARIVRHLLAESLLLAGFGTAAGLLLNLGLMKLITNLNLPLPVPIHLVVKPDARLLIYSIGIAIASALISGLMPALKAVRKDVNAALKSGERQTGRVWGLRSLLVAGQLTVSVVLLATGFLFLHNLLRATSMNPGFNVDHTVWAYMRLAPEKYKDQNKQKLLVSEALDRLRAMPGVEAAAVTRRVPLNDNCVTGISVQTDLSPQYVPITYFCNNVGPDYFRTIGIPILRGREFTARDREGAQPVVIVNETFARTIFPNTDPVGHTFLLDDGKRVLVVGLAQDSKYFSLGENPRPAVYESYFAYGEPVNLHFLARVSGPPSGYIKAITDELGRLDSSAAIETKPMSRALGFALLPSRAGAALLGTIGLLGLALAAIGLHGVLLYSISARTREIGLRMALGATPREILGLVCRHTAALSGIGSAVGLALTFLATRPLALFLVPGLRTSDPPALLAVLAILGVVVLAAGLVPAIRAMRVDPMTALRHE